MRQYFLTNDEPAKRGELATVLERLSFASVQVLETAAELCIDDYRPYGREPRPTCLPEGTLLVSMGQGAKHFAQVCHYMIQPLVELYGGCMEVLKVS